MIELLPALAAGLLGGAVMLAFQFGVTARIRGFDFLLLWASLMALEGRRSIGVIVHFLVSAAVAVLYAMGFAVADVSDAGWAWGLVGGVVHWLAAGSFIGVNGGDPDRLRVPGPFGMRLGAAVTLGFLVAHLVYGLVVGVAYFSLSAGGFSAAL
jgi:hypothetical protein